MGCLWLLVVFGVPLSWKKVGGGLELEWVSYSVLIRELSLGIEKPRGDGLIAWMSNIVSE